MFEICLTTVLNWKPLLASSSLLDFLPMACEAYPPFVHCVVGTAFVDYQLSFS
jgi:hypothetical protein